MSKVGSDFYETHWLVQLLCKYENESTSRFVCCRKRCRCDVLVVSAGRSCAKMNLLDDFSVAYVSD